MRKFVVLQMILLIVASAGLGSLFAVTSGSKVTNLNLVSAIQHITFVFILQRTKILTFSIQANNCSMLLVFGEMVDEVLKSLDYITVLVEDGTNNDAGGYREFNILFIDSFEALERINPGAKTSDYNINEYYLIVLDIHLGPKTRSNEMLKILTYFWSHYIINVTVLVEASPQVTDFYTFFPFSGLRCRNAEPVLINRFINDTLIYGFEHIFPKKLQTLQNCPLTAALWDSPPYFRIAPNKTGLEKFIDFEGILLGVLAQKLNFSLDYIIPPNDEQRGKRFPNGSTNGAMKLLQDRKIDLSLGSFRYTLERTEVLTAALPYYQTWQVFGLLKTSLAYTSIEILMFPFDTSTWISIVAFIGVIIAFGVLVASYQRIFAGIFFKISLNNLVASLLGVSIPRLPRANFTRYMLTMWIIFAFVIRSAYQSLLFQLLQSNLYRTPPNELEELVARDYTLIMTKGTFDSVNTIPKIQSNGIKFIVTDNSSEMSTFEFVEHTPGRFAGISPMDFLTYYAMTESGRGSFHIVAEKIFTQHITMYFTKHSFLIQRSKRVGQLKRILANVH